MTTSTARDRMLAGLPSTRTIDVAGNSTAILDLGEGPPLLLLHGGIESGGAMWAPVLARLARHHRVIAPDVPGLGESAPLDRLDTETFGRWLAGVIEETGLERATVVAHSLIGSLTARVATTADRSIERLVIYAAPGIGRYHMPLRLRYVAVRLAIRPTERNAQRFDRFALFDLDDTRRRDPVWYDVFAAYTLSRARAPQVKKTMRQLIVSQTKPISDTDLARIDIPTTLLWGRHDRMVPLSVGTAAATRFGWPLRVIERAVHAPHIEQPDDFVDALTAIATSA